jgi:hypothetical protein
VPTPPEHPEPQGSRLDVDFAALFAVPIGAVGAAGGPAARVGWWPRHLLGVGGGIALLSPASVSGTPAQAHLVRLPVDVGVRLRLPQDMAPAVLEAGLRMTLLSFDSPGRADSRWDAGARLGGHLRLGGRRSVGYIVGGEAGISARGYTIVLDPFGPSGTTPQLWLSFYAGLEWRME